MGCSQREGASSHQRIYLAEPGLEQGDELGHRGNEDGPDAVQVLVLGFGRVEVGRKNEAGGWKDDVEGPESPGWSWAAKRTDLRTAANVARPNRGWGMASRIIASVTPAMTANTETVNSPPRLESSRYDR